MIDLDDVKDGDTLVIEAEVVRYADGGIWMKSDWIRLDGKVSDEIKVIKHHPKPRIVEPTGVGAVVGGFWKNARRYQWVRISTDGDRPWQTANLPAACYSFNDLLRNCEDLEVLSEGV